MPINAIRAGVPERVVMELGGRRTRSVLDRYDITSEKDLGEALERTSRYVAERGAETPKVRPLGQARTEQPQSSHNPAVTASKWRRARGSRCAAE